MLWLPTADAELCHVISLCYIKPVWMNNEECLSLQNIPASLPLPRVLPLAQTGSCWASGTGAVGREGGGTGEHRGDWGETGSPLNLAFSSLFWKGGFSAGKTALYVVWQMYHLMQIFVFFEALSSFLTNVNLTFYHMHVLTVLF